MEDRRSTHQGGPGSRRSLSRAELLETLRQEGASTVQALARRTGLHENTVRGHLERLVADGRVVCDQADPAGRGRPRKVYRPASPERLERDDGQPASPSAQAASTRDAVLRRLVAGYGRQVTSVHEAAVGDGEAIARSLPLPPVAGQDPRHRQLNILLARLEDSGFAPSPDAEGTTVDLWGCPVRDLAAGRTDVVCAMHLGIERELARRAGGPLEVAGLCPFVGPRQCRLHLKRTDAA
ncbi:MAG: winged helix-turn-helix transcriptional regulator [Acidipropionibacterium acidipropionici]|jgi:predicted ArsR family transcriptional regulator|uniref:helix-turn-helix transcriptional regulator n=2 Tax=Bacillati TaxID=1783272 RepID=UPI0003F69922|nr:winged helix-turn-helix transcriptional regulator [Acidipropionibacterium acidipropionici]ALN14959.1 hypothetical protein ASQ49_06330 [Acidipropionibacterium acidipropionici]APZ09290.1 hypothetical protein BWX38_08600 [Acidipropionibacterium acidipropionici]